MSEEDTRRNNLMSKKDNIGFKCYEWRGTPIKISDEQTAGLFCNFKMFMINYDNIYVAPFKPDTRFKFLKFIDDWKNRLTHAWYALKGYDCD